MQRPYKYCPWCASKLGQRDVDGRHRLSCLDPECGYVVWENPIPVVAAIVEHEGRIILAHNRTWPDGVYSVITGFLEKTEAPERGVLREVEEELGLLGEVIDFIGVYAFPTMNQLILAYYVKATGNLVLNQELTRIKRIEKSKLKGWSFGTGLAVSDWVAKYGKIPSRETP
ncbi:MAG: NUDIX domain-containing protein [Gammaproteobacteria bacterium]